MSSLLAIAQGAVPARIAPALAQHHAAYRQLLLQHNWNWERAQDHMTWLQGRSDAKRIASYQRLIDPNFRIWNEYAPMVYRKGIVS